VRFGRSHSKEAADCLWRGCWIGIALAVTVHVLCKLQAVRGIKSGSFGWKYASATDLLYLQCQRRIVWGGSRMKKGQPESWPPKGEEVIGGATLYCGGCSDIAPPFFFDACSPAIFTDFT